MRAAIARRGEIVVDDLPAQREHTMATELPVHETVRSGDGPRLSKRRVALVTTAGRHCATDDTFSSPFDIQHGRLFSVSLKPSVQVGGPQQSEPAT